jgi:putative phage-type endonuclease
MMNHEEWLEWRRQGIGSSDAAIIMGMSPWRTQYELWTDKVYGYKGEDNSSMARGRELEPVARKWFEDTMNVCLFPKNKVNLEHEWIRASLDGMDVEDTMAVEIKCPNKEDHAAAVGNKVPEKYWPQVQHQLLVTGLEGMYYCSFNGCEGAIVEVARDNTYIRSMFEEENKFWAMVNSKTPPELCERDYRSMENDPEWLKWSEKWKRAKKVLDISEKEEKEAKDFLLMLCGRRNSQGNDVRVNRSVVMGNVDLDKLSKDYPDIQLHKYRKNSYEKCMVRAINKID